MHTSIMKQPRIQKNMHPLLTTTLLLIFVHCTSSNTIVLDGLSSSERSTVYICETTGICPSLTCGSNSINVALKLSELTTSKVDVQNIHLTDRRCKNFATSTDLLNVEWPLGLGICGTELIVNTTHGVYKNMIYLPPDVSQIIYREEIAINVSCTYPLDMLTSLGTVLWPIMSYTYIIVDGKGEFKVVMALFKDASFLTPYQENELQLSTQETLYVGVFIAEGDTTSFNLVMKNCFATPSNNVYNPVKYHMIKDSCPNSGDNTIKVYENGESSKGRFSVQMFKFIGDYSRVYLHCEVHLCYKLDGTICKPACTNKLYRSASSSPERSIISLGPIDRAVSVGTNGVGKMSNWNMMTFVGFILSVYLFF
ncbi:uromodulin-like [Spea bombifrons]|uniref:uromodulin-like n=1 Tax=Spea bombifrons TaxID=233779 RepID=UPI00234992C2|nr:uromodulin-like [Spea bombifrons]